MMTPAATLDLLRARHICVPGPVPHCHACQVNWPCDVVRAIEASALAERARIREAAGDDLPARLRLALGTGGGRA